MPHTWRDRPTILREVTPNFDWDLKKVRALQLPVRRLRLVDLLWHFDLPFWEREGTDDWNLTVWEVFRDPHGERSHYSRVWGADLRYPIDVVWWNGRYRVLDGLHRLAKAYLTGAGTIRARVVPPEMFARILH
ncbi:MAG: hypothetical protein ABIO72_00720 [Patescibacteria group bacterium]